MLAASAVPSRSFACWIASSDLAPVGGQVLALGTAPSPKIRLVVRQITLVVWVDWGAVLSEAPAAFAAAAFAASAAASAAAASSAATTATATRAMATTPIIIARTALVLLREVAAARFAFVGTTGHVIASAPVRKSDFRFLS